MHDGKGEFLFEDGDLKIGQSDEQHVGDIFITQKGENKEFPLVGFGAINYIKTSISASEFKRDLKIQLEYDDYKNADIDLSQGIENVKINI